MGGQPGTLAGSGRPGRSSTLTCSGDLSRNRQVGLELAKGRSIQDITGSMSMVAEGVRDYVVRRSDLAPDLAWIFR